MVFEDSELKQLPHERPVPDSLEERVVATLSQRGLLRSASVGSRTNRWVRWSGLAAAGVAMLLAGVWVGRQSIDPNTVGRAEFMLLLYEGPEFEAYTDANYGQRFNDFSEWIAALREAGQFVGGEALDSTAIVLVPGAQNTVAEERLPSAGDGVIDGVLLIAAADYDEAVRIARSSPHVRYGGRIAVRRVAPT